MLVLRRSGSTRAGFRWNVTELFLLEIDSYMVGNDYYDEEFYG